ncbi:SLC17A5 [Mytilus coruscus]|uniref:Sialin n=1 Tax=Mytilus coruscus TaxID=42192 RepID=A0A6J8A985_MYTCO|nr:SLC17A5 [Mytilus coruscus]
MDKITDKTQDSTNPCCAQRWILAFIFSAGFFFVYALRVNLSVALVCMVKTEHDNTTISKMASMNGSRDACSEIQASSQNFNERAEFDWDKETRSSLLSAFFYGYIITQIPGGWLADRFGGTRVFGIAMGVSGICTVLLPVCARTSVVLVFILRVILGLVQGVVHPACYSLWGRWAPRFETSKLLAVSCVGSIIGIITTFATSGLLCEYGFDNGWGSIFYITGGLCCIWVVLWFVQVRDSPSKHPRISEVERSYIENNIVFDTRKKNLTTPWKDMVKSAPLWALLICHSCSNWADYTLMTSLPAFMKEVLRFDIKSNGALSATPYICSSVSVLLVAHSADRLRSKHILTTTQTRKIFQSIAFIGGSIFLVATGFVPCSKRELAVVFLCIAVFLNGFNAAGYGANHIDIAPKYAGLLIGITNTAATIPGIISPMVAGALTPNGDPEEWRSVFYVAAGFYITGMVIFAIFGSGEIQPWAMDKEIEIKVSSSLLCPVNKENDKQVVPGNGTVKQRLFIENNDNHNDSDDIQNTKLE